MDNFLDSSPGGFLSLSGDGTILAANKTLCVLLGYGVGALDGQPFSTILAAGGRVFYQTSLIPQLMLHGKAEEIYLSLRSQSGEPIPMLLSAAQREAESGPVTDCVLLTIYQRLHFESELLQARKIADEASAEAAKANERERLIAGQLQEALQPALPSFVPGLALAQYFEPALQLSEGVGGDFYDCFALGGGRTALVVGDLVGKGLAAASQTATVRNMLRAFLYTEPSLLVAITRLNTVLVTWDLLTGFSTLFVGIYNSAARSLTYVNCGQEPALIRRAATEFSDISVEELGATGPILGALADENFAEATALLAPGDALAVFTDGLTEVGETRRTMLGIEGVTAIFRAPIPQPQCGAEAAKSLTQSLITGVDAAAKTGIRDDVCLLIAVAEPTSSL